MSRIQNILDKAERDGALRRIRPLPESVTAAVAATGEAPAVSGASPGPSGSEAVALTGGTIVRPLVLGTGPSVSAAAAEAVPQAAPPSTLTSVMSESGETSKVRLDPRLVVATAADGVPAEQYRALRTRIVHTDSGGAVNVVLVTSPGRGEGKSLTVANLGLTMAQDSQQRICVVDADLRAPQQAALFGIPEAPGLSDVLIGRATLERALVRIDECQISVLPAGAPAAHPAELLGTVIMRRVLETLGTRFDRVLIDVPAASPLADVAILSPLADSVLLVVRAGVTSKPAIHDAVSAIDPRKLLGFVLNEAAA